MIHRLARSLLLRLGFRLYRVSHFEKALARLFYRNGGFSFVQIGAYDGVSYDDLYWLVQRYGGSGIAVEPLPHVFTRLQMNYVWMDSVTPVQRAVHSDAKSIKMYYVDSSDPAFGNWALGSSSVEKSHLTDAGIPEHAIKDVTVDCIHLMDLLAEFGFYHLDVLQVDAEGYDHEVIRMIDFGRIRPKVIKYEYSKRTEPEVVANEAKMMEWLQSLHYVVSLEGGDVVAELIE